MNLTLILDLALAGHPDRTAVVCPDSRLTYADIDRLARGLAAGIVADERAAVVYIGPSAPSLPVALFAAARAGVPFIPLNYRLSAERLDALLADHPDALVVRADDEIAPLSGETENAPDAPVDEDLPAVIGQNEEGMQSFTWALADLVKKEWVAMSTAMAYAPNREALASTLKGVEVKAATLVSRIRVAGNRS